LTPRIFIMISVGSSVNMVTISLNSSCRSNTATIRPTKELVDSFGQTFIGGIFMGACVSVLVRDNINPVQNVFMSCETLGHESQLHLSLSQTITDLLLLCRPQILFNTRPIRTGMYSGARCLAWIITTGQNHLELQMESDGWGWGFGRH
jgi:hypothetical protein